jgi:hypothetical protein
LSAQLLPERIGLDRLASKTAAPQPEPGIWRELGLEDSARGTYEGADGHYTLTLYRLQDPTAALAAFYWQRPPDARTGKLTRLDAETDGSLTVGSGNYLLVWNGHRPPENELNALLMVVPKYEHGNLPALIDFMPARGLRPNSERYIVGPESLARFFPVVSPAAAAFHMSAEGEIAQFGKEGGIKLAVFSYPTPEIARKQLPEFEKIPGAMVKRSGPLLAVTVNPQDLNEAERLLSLVRYQVDITVPAKPKSKKDDPVNLLLNIALLIGILIVFCTISGLLFGLLRQILHRFGPSDDGDAMVSLHLSGR